MLKKTQQTIFNELKQLLNQAYCPYSSFQVACIIETYNEQKQWNYYYGVNVENASYSLTVCAERNALFSFVTKRTNKNEAIQKIFILANNLLKKDPINIVPCGACRQVLQEFLPEHGVIICYSINNQAKTFDINDLLPNSFKLKE